MADIEVQYKNATIKQQTGSGTVTLHTEGKYMEDDVDIVYTAPGGGGSKVLNVTTGTNIATTLCGTYDVDEINVTAGSAAAAKKISMFRCYGFVGAPTKFKYSGFAYDSATLTDYFRASVSKTSEVDFGNVQLPPTLSRFFYDIENTADLTTYIKGLDWTNVTSMSGVFQGGKTYATYLANNRYLDVEWLGTVNCASFNICPNTTWEVPFTHRSLVELMNALGTGGGSCKIGTNNLATLSAAEQAIATAKGWTLS